MKQVSYKQGDRHGCNAFDAQRPWRVASVSLLRAETTAPPATEGAGGRGRHQLLGVRGHVIAAAKEAPLASGNGRGLHFPREATLETTTLQKTKKWFVRLPLAFGRQLRV
jgi:hypothetical protein